MNNIELNDEERRKLLNLSDTGLDYEIEDYVNSILLKRHEKNIKDIQGCIVNSEDWEELINNLHLVFKTNQ